MSDESPVNPNNSPCRPGSRSNQGRVLVLCDFDGTVSTKDTVNRLVRTHLTSPEWRYHVKRYLLGEIGSKAVYEALAPLMSMSREDLERFVQEHAALDPGFPGFLKWAASHEIDVKIVSDGFDQTIRTLFRRHGIEGLDIYANRLVLGEKGDVRIEHPFSNEGCGICGTCKVRVLRNFRDEYDRIVLVGDGESDRHAATEADHVLALKDLFLYCVRHGIPAIRLDGFDEAPALLSRRIQAVAFDLDGTLIDSLEPLTDAFNHMFEALGYPLMTRDEVARNTSAALIEFAKAFLKPDEVEIGIKVFRDYYSGMYLERTKVMNGAGETLDAIDPRIALGIVTNKKGIFARKIADRFGWTQRMVKVIGAEDGYKTKPDAEMFRLFMNAASSTPERTVYVGDSPVDIRAARNAGIDAFAVASQVFSPHELALHKPRRVLRSISELPAALEPIIDLDPV